MDAHDCKRLLRRGLCLYLKQALARENKSIVWVSSLLLARGEHVLSIISTDTDCRSAEHAASMRLLCRSPPSSLVPVSEMYSLDRLALPEIRLENASFFLIRLLSRTQPLNSATSLV